MMKDIIWMNGKLIGKKKAVISVFDHGFLYGDGIFETMRAYNGRVFRLDKHMTRLYSGAQILGIRIPYSSQWLTRTVSRLVAIVKSTDAYVRIAITRGRGRFGLDPAFCKNPAVIVNVKSFKGYPHSFYQKGAKVCISSSRRDHASPLSNLKSMNYLVNILAFIEAKKKKKDDAITLNTDGFVAEATTSNVFMIKGNVIITPRTSEGLLPGITRDVIIALARSIGFNVSEKRVRVADLKRADEIFLTNSIVEIRGIVEMDGSIIADGTIGPVTKLLHHLYRQSVSDKNYNSI
jgi:branched-chain amino acid aminotransferase